MWITTLIRAILHSELCFDVKTWIFCRKTRFSVMFELIFPSFHDFYCFFTIHCKKMRGTTFVKAQRCSELSSDHFYMSDFFKNTENLIFFNQFSLCGKFLYYFYEVVCPAQLFLIHKHGLVLLSHLKIRFLGKNFPSLYLNEKKIIV